MRIGLDARFLTHPQRGGFKTYTQNLITAISRLDEENEYFIYVDRLYEPGILPSKKNFTFRILGGTLPLLGMIFREQILLPIYVWVDKVEILHSLCNTAPVFVPAKKVVTLHDTIQVTSSGVLKDLSNIKAWGIAAYSKWSVLRYIHKSDCIITVSEFEKRGIIDLFGIPREGVTVTHLAPNLIFKPASPIKKDEFRATLLEKFSIKKDFILSVGFEDRKNIPLVIEMYKKMSHEFPNLNLVIVSADMSKVLLFQETVKSCYLNDRVTILGPTEPSDLLMLYNLAKVFVFPSERESFGLPPLEAISCGVPTIAMKASSLPEILGDGALLIDGKDIQKWTDAIRHVLVDTNYQRGMIERGLKRASELSWDQCARETIDAYRAVIG